jgi:hypothetical protein
MGLRCVRRCAELALDLDGPADSRLDFRDGVFGTATTGGAMKIYVAATYGRASEMKAIARLLREEGHEVTSECWHDSTTEEKQLEYEEWERGRWHDDNEPVSFEQWCASEDARGVRAADMVVMVTDQVQDIKLPFQSTGGRHFEFGLALGIGGKYLVLVGEPENVFHHVPIIKRFPTWDAFFAALPVYEHAHLAMFNLRKDALRGNG